MFALGISDLSLTTSRYSAGLPQAITGLCAGHATQLPIPKKIFSSTTPGAAPSARADVDDLAASMATLTISIPQHEQGVQSIQAMVKQLISMVHSCWQKLGEGQNSDPKRQGAQSQQSGFADRVVHLLYILRAFMRNGDLSRCVGRALLVDVFKISLMTLCSTLVRVQIASNQLFAEVCRRLYGVDSLDGPQHQAFSDDPQPDDNVDDITTEDAVFSTDPFSRRFRPIPLETIGDAGAILCDNVLLTTITNRLMAASRFQPKDCQGIIGGWRSMELCSNLILSFLSRLDFTTCAHLSWFQPLRSIVEVLLGSPSQTSRKLKKNLANKIFGHSARCEFWLKLGLRFWIFVGYVDFLTKFGAKFDFRV